MRTVKTVERFEDTMIETTIEIETNPATINYRDILEACEVVSDDDMGAPWDEMSGWDHDTERTYDSCQEDARGYSPEINRVVVLDDAEFRDDYRHYRKNGCSKQTAAEMVARLKQQRLDTLVGWHENGCEWYGVRGEFLDRSASVWGIDDYDYARDDVRHDIASEIASELEDDGYTVTHRPDPVKQARQDKRDRLKRNLNLDCWTD